MSHKWLLVAKNEYRIRTSSIRKIRPFLPVIVVFLLSVYVVVIAPALVKVFFDDVLAFLLSHVALAMTEILLFMGFAYFVVLPITSSLREQGTRQVEIFLSAPIRAGDVLLGEFLGTIPLYAIFITLITGLFAALLAPLGLSSFQMITTVVVVIVVFLSALWIGTVLSAALRTRLGKTAKGRDIGRALGMILALPIIAMYYVIAFGGLLETLADPAASGLVKTALGWLPSSWGAEVILAFASHPGDSAACGLITGIRVIGLLAFFAVILIVGTRLADRIYSLEITSFIGSEANPDGIFYKTVRYLAGGGHFGRVVVSLFKDFSRRLENISGISYMLGLLFLMVVLLAPQSAGPDDPPAGLLFLEFIFPIIVVMVTGDVTVRGKQSLFLFRKAPSGEARFIEGMLVKSGLITVPIVGVVTGVIGFFTLQGEVKLLLAVIVAMMVYVAGYVVFILGLFLLNPAFSEKSVTLWVNIVIAVFFSIGLFVISLVVLTEGGQMSEPAGGLPGVFLLQGIVCWVVGVIVLRLGRERFSRIE
jgi:hypothetical protein